MTDRYKYCTACGAAVLFTDTGASGIPKQYHDCKNNAATRSLRPAHARWPSIQRLSSETCYITEKIDGTNGVIYVPENPEEPLHAGSRNRWLTNEDGTPPTKVGDNYDFAAWVYERADTLRAKYGPGTHYGEFYGQGIARKYGLAERRFAPFDRRLEGSVPLLYEGEPTEDCVNNMVQFLIANGSVLVPGFMDPEGVVITFREMSSAKFKKMCRNDRIRKSAQ